jgi:hypothetical protein
MRRSRCNPRIGSRSPGTIIFTAHALFGRPGNNPYCHFRARTLAAQGKRERLVPGAPAEGRPFDHGLFDIVVEDLHAPEAMAPAETPEQLVQIARRPMRGRAAQ